MPTSTQMPIARPARSEATEDRVDRALGKVEPLIDEQIRYVDAAHLAQIQRPQHESDDLASWRGSAHDPPTYAPTRLSLGDPRDSRYLASLCMT